MQLKSKATLIEVLTAEAAETAAATGKIVSPPALAKLHAEAAIARAAENAASRKAAQAQDDQFNLRTELDDMRQNLRFALRAATAVEAEAALDPIKMDLARAAVVTCHGIFPASATRVRPKEGTDNEANNSNRRADHRDLAGA